MDNNIKLWEVSNYKHNLKCKVFADCMDKALEKARTIDKRYNTVRVISDNEIDNMAQEVYNKFVENMVKKFMERK